MNDKKSEEHEHHEEHHSENGRASKTVAIKKSTLWGIGAFVLVALLVASILTGGFGITKPSGYAASTGNTGASSGTTSPAATGGGNLLQVIQDNPTLFPTMGPSNAKVTVTEFLDFQCPYCGIASGLVPWGSQVQTQYSDQFGVAEKLQQMAQQGKIRFAVGVMSFLGQESVYAAQAGYCANQQGKFFEMDNAIYSAQTQGENSGKFDKDKLEIIAQNVTGLNQAQFKDCLGNDKTLSLVQQSASLTSQFAQGTPTFYVNNQQVQWSWSAMQSAINAAS